MNQEPVTETVGAVAPLIGHVHASEPMLAAVGAGGASHTEAGAALRAARPDLAVTIEMTRPAEAPVRETIEHAVRTAQLAYGDLP